STMVDRLIPDTKTRQFDNANTRRMFELIPRGSVEKHQLRFSRFHCLDRRVRSKDNLQNDATNVRGTMPPIHIPFIRYLLVMLPLTKHVRPSSDGMLTEVGPPQIAIRIFP